MNKTIINKNDFHKFLSLVTLRNQLEIKEAVFNISPNLISTQAVLIDEKVGTTPIFALKTSFKGVFENLGNLGIGNLSILKKFTSSAKKDFVLKKTENKLIAEIDKIKFSSDLRKPEYISNSLSDEKYSLLKNKSSGNLFVLKKEEVKKAVDYFSAVSAEKIFLSGKESVFSIVYHNSDRNLKIDFDLEESVKEFEISVSPIFMDLLISLVGYDASFSMNTSCPIYVAVNDDVVESEYFLAPLK